MHELGVVIEVVKQVEQFACENNISQIETLVLQVGELSSMVPAYIEKVYPIAVEETSLHKTELKIEITPGIVQCKKCDFVYKVIQSEHQCPRCRSIEWVVLSGTDFMIKEILAK